MSSSRGWATLAGLVAGTAIVVGAYADVPIGRCDTGAGEVRTTEIKILDCQNRPWTATLEPNNKSFRWRPGPGNTLPVILGDALAYLPDGADECVTSTWQPAEHNWAHWWGSTPNPQRPPSQEVHYRMWTGQFAFGPIVHKAWMRRVETAGHRDAFCVRDLGP